MMMIRFLLFALVILPLGSLQANMWTSVKSFLGFKEATPPPKIRILILDDVTEIDLETRGVYSLYDPNVDDRVENVENDRVIEDNSKGYISSRFAGKRRPLTALTDGLKWGELFPGVYQLRVHPEEKDSAILVNGQRYLGDVYFYDIDKKTETLGAVNHVTIEEFLQSTLADVTEKVHPETMAALVIVARTNAYYLVLHPKTGFWDVDATKIGYRGDVAPRLIEVTNALNQTRNMVLSSTGIYEGTVTPFPAEFGFIKTPVPNARKSAITIEEANKMAEGGAHAAQILGRAFPNTVINLIPY